MGSGVAKQYLCIAGKPVIRWAIQPFLDDARVSGMVVVLAPGDRHWSACAPNAGDKLFLTEHGGSKRVHSVRNGLRALERYAQPRDWILIHDAARPCLTLDDLDCLLGRLWDDEGCVQLALRVRVTHKQESDEECVVAFTLGPAWVWLAQTPQMFPNG